MGYTPFHLGDPVFTQGRVKASSQQQLCHPDAGGPEWCFAYGCVQGRSWGHALGHAACVIKILFPTYISFTL